MTAANRTVALTVVAALAAGSALAQARRPPGHFGGHAPHAGWHHVRHGSHYPFWGGFGLGLGLGVVSGWYWDWPYHGGYYGGYYGAPTVVYGIAPPPAGTGYTVSTMPLLPETIYYPRNGQSDAQRETDLRECNRWATTQPPAMAEATAFQRAVLACMDGRGYTGR